MASLSLCAAAAQLRRQAPELTVLAIGTGGAQDRPRPASPVRELGPVTEQEKWDALDAADMLGLPSTADLFPLVFVEAWTVGTPVISGAFEGIADAVHDGVDGLVVADDAALVRAIARLTAEPETARRLGTNGRAAVARSLNWSTVGHNMVAAYRAAAQQRRPTVRRRCTEVAQ